MTTERPPSCAIRAASTLTIPSCSQRHRAPAATASARVWRTQLGTAEDVDDVDRTLSRDGVGERRDRPSNPR